MTQAPGVGSVIRYAFLWSRERKLGREEGAKHRPCAVVLSLTNQRGPARLYVLPISHARPVRPETAYELPRRTRARLGLDDEPSWIELTEVNDFDWPGPDVRPAEGESIVMGVLPGDALREIQRRFLALYRAGKVELSRRTD